MLDIVEEKRETKSSLKFGFEERKRIHFHIASVQGLPQSSWSSVSTSLVVENVDVKKHEYYTTGSKKSHPRITWSESFTLNDLKDSSKVYFEVRSTLLWSKPLLRTTETFTLQEMLSMQHKAEEDGNSSFDLVITHSSSMSTNESTPSLSLKAVEMPTKNGNHALTAPDTERFVNECRNEALEDLSRLFEKMMYLRKTLEGSSFVSLVDILLGALEGVHKAVATPTTNNINKNTVECIRAINRCFSHYQSLSGRQMSKRGQNAMALMKEMLCGATLCLERIETVLRRSNRFESDKLEFKVTDWLGYFENCEVYLSETDPHMKKPEDPVYKKSRRVVCPSSMVASLLLPATNVLPMHLPEIYTPGGYDRPDLTRLVSEWVFSTSFRHASPTTDRNHPKPKSAHILCLSGTAGSGKTQLAAHMADWLRELRCLGGYYTFRKDTMRSQDNSLVAWSKVTPIQTLDALPLTLVHQACVVEPDAAGYLSDAFAKNPSAVDESLEKRFEALFITPMHKFVSGGAAWDSLPPMVFIIDGLGDSTSKISPPGEETEDKETDLTRMTSLFAEWITSKSIRSLPPHIKFLIFLRPGTNIGTMIAEKGAGFVCDIAHIVQYVENSPSSVSLRSDATGDIAHQWSATADGTPTPPSPSMKALGELSWVYYILRASFNL